MAKLGDMEVWQANALVEAAQPLTLVEKRLLLAAAALHDPRRPMPAHGTVDLHVEDFREVFGLDESKSVYEALADAAKRLYERSIRRKYVRNGREVVEEVRWVWIARYVKGEGRVTLGFSPAIAPYLTLLHQRFTRFKLKHIGRLGSYYSVRLYELMSEFRVASRRSIDLDKLREMLGVDGKYEDIKNLRVRVLDPAIREINQHTDLRVVMTPQRRGRKVVGFQFDIQPSAQLALELPGGGESEPASDQA